MNVRNCKKCNRIFNYIAGPTICPACKEDLEKKFQKDPVSFFNSQRGGGSGPGGSRGPGGPSFDPKQMQNMKKRMENEIKSRNNPIELK